MSPARSSSTAPPRDWTSPLPSAEIKARNAAFDAFGRYDCTECEGGHGFDSWAQQSFAGQLRGYNAWAEKIGAMAVGDSLPWKGMRANGLLVIASADPVGPFPCKQVHYLLTKDKATAERDGLFCQGRLNQFDAGPSWVEVY